MESVSTESPNFQTRPHIKRFRSKFIEPLPRIHDLPSPRRRGNRKRTAEIDFGIEAALASLEVPGGRGDANFSVRKVPDFGLADSAPGCDHLDSGGHELLDQAGLEALQVNLLRSRRDDEAHPFRDLAPPQHPRGNLDVLEAAVGTRAYQGLIDAGSLY